MEVWLIERRSRVCAGEDEIRLSYTEKVGYFIPVRCKSVPCSRRLAFQIASVELVLMLDFSQEVFGHPWLGWTDVRSGLAMFWRFLTVLCS